MLFLFLLWLLHMEPNFTETVLISELIVDGLDNDVMFVDSRVGNARIVERQDGVVATDQGEFLRVFFQI